MHRRDFLKTTTASALAATLPIPLIGKKEPKQESGWEHFEFICGDGPDAKYRCKLCKGTFWVDACTEENLGLYQFSHKDYAELVPVCEWCKLHEGYGMPVVPGNWGSQISRFRNLHDEGVGYEKYLYDWADSAIEGHVNNRWAEYTEYTDFSTCVVRREVFLRLGQGIVCCHPEGRYIERLGGHYKWGWGKMFLVRTMELPLPLSKFTPFIVYGFLPTPETQYANYCPHRRGV